MARSVKAESGGTKVVKENGTGDLDRLVSEFIVAPEQRISLAKQYKTCVDLSTVSKEELIAQD